MTSLLRSDGAHPGTDADIGALAGPVETTRRELGIEPRRTWSVLTVALTAQILVVLDISVVNTALPSIGRSLKLDGGRS